jgi:O-antigen/teichoic acid export membrane protein
MALLAISTLFGTAVAPGVARAWAEGTDAASRAIHAALRGAAVMFFPLVLGGVLIAPRLVSTLFGARYAPATTPLRLLLGALLTAAFIDVLRRGLHFGHRQHDDLVNMVICAAASIALTSALVPRFGATGAASALVLADVTLLGMTLRSVARAGLSVRLPAALIKPGFAATAMGLILFPLRGWSVAITVPLAGVVFGLTLVLLRDTTLAGLRVLDAPETAEVREVDSALATESPSHNVP